MSSASSSSSSAPSSASNSPQPSPGPQLKRKREQDSSGSDTSSDSGSDPESATDNDKGEGEGDDNDGAPALSHAERRRQKKKVKLDAKGTSKAKAKDAAPLKRQNSVWVGNLSFKTTPEALREFFESAGEITRVHMPTKAGRPGAKAENRGFAYVDFATADAKIAAIALSEKPLIGRRLLIKDGDDFTGRPAGAAVEGVADVLKSLTGHSKTAQKILYAQKQPPAPTLFLGNLGFETTEQSIRQLLEAHRGPKKKLGGEFGGEGQKGEEEKEDVWIRKIRMGTFEDSGLCKGFAFVDFTTTEHATAALINPKNHSLDGRKLTVEYASADAVRRGRGIVQPTGEEAVQGNQQKRKPPRPMKMERQELQRLLKEHPVEAAVEDEGSVVRPRRKSFGDAYPPSRGRPDKGPRPRSKPGAALAMAKRESAAIVPSSGTKIQF